MSRLSRNGKEILFNFKREKIFALVKRSFLNNLLGSTGIVSYIFGAAKNIVPFLPLTTELFYSLGFTSLKSVVIPETFKNTLYEFKKFIAREELITPNIVFDVKRSFSSTSLEKPKKTSGYNSMLLVSFE